MGMVENAVEKRDGLSMGAMEVVQGVPHPTPIWGIRRQQYTVQAVPIQLLVCTQMRAVVPRPYSCKRVSEPQDWLLLLMVGVLNLLQVLCVHHVFDARTCRGTGGKA